MPYPFTWDRTQPTFSICGVFLSSLFDGELLTLSDPTLFHTTSMWWTFNSAPFQFSEHGPKNSTHTRFEVVRLRHLEFFVFVFVFSPSFMLIHSSWTMLFQKPSHWLPCEWFPRPWYLVFKWRCQNSKTPYFLQNPVLHLTLCNKNYSKKKKRKQKQNLLEWNWVATPNAKWQEVQKLWVITRSQSREEAILGKF